MRECVEEALYMKEMVLRKFVYDELDVMALHRMLGRIYDLAYYNGRCDGEKYGRNLND